MNIISDFSKDTQTEKPIPGSYEWWYFDAQTVCGYKIVVIFYEGNPFSRRYIQALEKGSKKTAHGFPAISISVYEDGKPVYYSFRETNPEYAHFSDNQPSGRVEECSFQGTLKKNKIEYKLKLDQKLPNGDSIQATLMFQKNNYTPSNFQASSSSSESHEWNLVLPSCQVSGEISIQGYSSKHLEFRGSGYHDHNTGFEPLKDSFKEWYWGRYHFEERTFIYYLMNCDNSWENKAWLVEENGGISECGDIQISEYSSSIFGLKTARKIECSAGENGIFLQLDQMLDNGPFYQRFGGRAIFKNRTVVEEASGISEYIKPHRIYNRLFFPLVDMRISYPEKNHWVQKNPRLFRWTW